MGPGAKPLRGAGGGKNAALLADHGACAGADGALFALGALLSATVLYASYYQGGRSIYLMRRLPDGGRTLRRQVWTVPLRWMVACIAAAAALSVLCWAAWRLITPAQTLGHGLFGIWS